MYRERGLREPVTCLSGIQTPCLINSGPGALFIRPNDIRIPLSNVIKTCLDFGFKKELDCIVMHLDDRI
jgi:hypothetical protein